MMFFVSLAWLFALRIAEHGRWRDYLLRRRVRRGGHRIQVLGRVHPRRRSASRIWSRRAVRATWTDVRGWLAWTARGLSPLVVCALAFAIINPMAFLYYPKFRQDIVEQIVSPLTGASKPIWMAQFSDVQPQLYWFTTNLWWGFGPALEVWGLLGIAWLLWRPYARGDRRRRLSDDLLLDRRRHDRADGPLRAAAGAGVRRRGRRLQRVPARSPRAGGRWPLPRPAWSWRRRRSTRSPT